MTSERENEIPKAKLKDLYILFFAAIIVRSVYTIWGRWWAGDSHEYIAMARNIAFHYSFSQADGLPTAWRPPLYPSLIAVLWWTDGAPVAAILVVQILFGAATAVLVYLIALERFSRSVALTAALGMTFAPMSVHCTAGIMTETLFTFLITFGIFFWARNQAVVAGLAFGLAALTRPIIIPFLVGLLILSLARPWRQRRRMYLVIFLVAIAVSSVWITRNAIVFRKFILIQSGGYGVNLFAGTIEVKFLGEDPWPRVLSELKTENSTDEMELDRKFMRRAIGRITNDPLNYLKARIKQYPRLFLDSGDYLLGSHNVAFGEALREPRPLVVVSKIAFMLGNIGVLFLAIYGAFVVRKRLVVLSHIVLFPVFLTVIHLPMWIESRYSLPMMPLVAILAAVGLEGLVKYGAKAVGQHNYAGA